MGAFGFSMLPTLSLLIFPIFCLFKQKLLLNKYIYPMIKIEMYLLIVNLIVLLIYYVIYGNLVIMDETLPVKSLKCNLYWVSYVVFIILIYNIIVKYNEKKALFPFVLTFFLMIVICFFEIQSSPYAFENLHYNGTFPYWRVRLLTTESSHTAGMIISYFFITLHYFTNVVKSKIFAGLSIVGMGYLILCSGSKTLLAMFIVGVILIFIKSFKFSAKNIIKNIIFFIIAYWFITAYVFPRLSTAITMGIEESGTVFTRVFTCAVGFICGIIYPFGTGNGAYLKIFPELLEKGIQIYNKMNIDLGDTSEVWGYINATNDSAVAVKSGLLQYNMYWGIFGSIYIVSNFAKLYFDVVKNKNLIILGVGFILSFATMCIGSLDFDFWFYVVVLMYYFHRNNLFKND